MAGMTIHIDGELAIRLRRMADAAGMPVEAFALQILDMALEGAALAASVEASLTKEP